MNDKKWRRRPLKGREGCTRDVETPNHMLLRMVAGGWHKGERTERETLHIRSTRRLQQDGCQVPKKNNKIIGGLRRAFRGRNSFKAPLPYAPPPRRMIQKQTKTLFLPPYFTVRMAKRVAAMDFPDAEGGTTSDDASL